MTVNGTRQVYESNHFGKKKCCALLVSLFAFQHLGLQFSLELNSIPIKKQNSSAIKEGHNFAPDILSTLRM